MIFTLAWQQLISQWKSGDLRVMVFALILAVTSITAVNFFTNRIALHLNSQGGLLLGGDLVLISDHAVPEAYFTAAKQHGLQTANTFEFASMVIKNEKNQLSEIKALGENFPLRGDFGVQFAQDNLAKSVQGRPNKGEVWIESRLANALAVKLGETVELGAQDFTVTGILTREPSRGGDMFSFAPRLIMHADDLPATELLQFGSRVKYQLLVAGDSAQVQDFSQQIATKLARGEKVQDVKTARPEIKSALDKAETFLGLSAMVSVVLSIVAMLLASAPFIARSAETSALLRCFGASKSTIQAIMLLQTGFLALIGGVLGCLLGYLVQQGLAYFAGSLFLESLPESGISPIFIGLSLGFALLLAIIWPHIEALKSVPTLRILRDDIQESTSTIWRRYLPVLLVVVALILWQAKTFKLAVAFLAGILSICLIAGLLAYALSKTLFGVSQKTTNQSVSLGLSNLKRRLGLTTAQVVGFSLGAMVLMLLMMIKTDLMQSWQASLPVDAPNRFIINIQPNQVQQVQAFSKNIGIANPQIFPMVRGRLVAKNNVPISADQFDDERAKRLVSREFNLSMAAQMQADNKLLQGRWWREDEAGKPLLSLEEDIAQTLDIKLGDRLTYDIAGSQIVLTVSSIRKVEWDSMRANFFAVTPPGTLKDYPASYLTAFYLPKNQDNTLNQLLQKFPNFTIIDVASLMNQVRDIMQKMSLAVGFVFIFCVVAGVIVLYAALVATRDARIKETTLLRVLGASRRQVTVTMLTEFACIGAMAASIAIIVASSLAYYLSRFVLEIPYQFNINLALSVLAIALVSVPLAAWLIVRGYLNIPTKQLLNSI